MSGLFLRSGVAVRLDAGEGSSGRKMGSNFCFPFLSPFSDAESEVDVKSKFCQVFSPEMEKRLCTLYAKRLLVFFKGCLKKVLGGVRAQA